ncbi:uncharacterized protein ARMOST_14457 [Armillaria ostoyae]|uniref:Uncharacterized protein n=1 Tax=Armillaria ostoyae TaxID=47428 RepID=A0A284RQK2_ARMOS|nr:uncharacterized protein ARMOST_14457 [Armillaria ostoyae]
MPKTPKDDPQPVENTTASYNGFLRGSGTRNWGLLRTYLEECTGFDAEILEDGCRSGFRRSLPLTFRIAEPSSQLHFSLRIIWSMHAPLVQSRHSPVSVRYMSLEYRTREAVTDSKFCFLVLTNATQDELSRIRHHRESLTSQQCKLSQQAKHLLAREQLRRGLVTLLASYWEELAGHRSRAISDLEHHQTELGRDSYHVYTS